MRTATPMQSGQQASGAPSPLAPTAAGSRAPVGSAAFSLLIDGFRERLDREIGAFLAGKRAAALGSEAALGAPPAAAASVDGLSGSGDLVEGVARLIAQGGKRLRPALVYYTYRACGGRCDELVIPVALATEFLHTYLLIHDDIMDHAEVRRGQPAAHARFRDLHRAGSWRGDSGDFGRSVAILLGDLAHSYAVELFTTALFPIVRPAAATSSSPTGAPGSGSAIRQAEPPTPAPHRVELNRCFSEMCEEVIGGQYLEFLLAHRGISGAAGSVSAAAMSGPLEAAPGAAFDSAQAANAAHAPNAADSAREAELLRVLRLKSGRYTAERPIQLGALLAGAEPGHLAELSRYGTAVGEAFQLRDDLLGMFGDPATTGKPVGDDLREGKFTLLIHHALVNGSPADRQLIAAALGNPDLTAAEVSRVQAVLEHTGARRMVAAMIAQRLGAARRALDALLASGAIGGRHGGHDERTEGLGDAAGPRFLAGLLDYLREREQ
ncbi:MAG TPA: polyprenyl synthetase family protein [Thermoanaerobaculia bacterium]|nr:polyprenyl synthetase family protein [Thermoanaerobaculia bacterium]